MTRFRFYLEICAQNLLCATVSAYLFVAIVVVLICLGSRLAHAHDHNQPQLNNFYSSLKDKHGNSCCNQTDCHEAEAEIRGEHWWAQLSVKENGEWVTRPEWMQIPDDKVIKHDNPTGKAIFCHTIAWKLGTGTHASDFQLETHDITVRCFLPQEQV